MPIKPQQILPHMNKCGCVTVSKFCKMNGMCCFFCGDTSCENRCGQKAVCNMLDKEKPKRKKKIPGAREKKLHAERMRRYREKLRERQAV